MKKIMFICHGNICRSPMAEAIFNDLAEKKGLKDKYFAASSAVSTEEIYRGVGNPIDQRARRTLSKYNVPVGDHRATLLTREDYTEYDLLVCMDGSNRRHALRIVGRDPENKIKCMSDFLGRDVADPWYSGDFERAYEDITKGCRALMEYLEK